MAQELAFRFAVVLALAVIVLVVMTSAAPPHTENDTAALIPLSEAIKTETHNTSGDYMDIYTVLLIVFLTFGIGFVLDRVIG
jgi:hypothetical protein